MASDRRTAGWHWSDDLGVLWFNDEMVFDMGCRDEVCHCSALVPSKENAVLIVAILNASNAIPKAYDWGLPDEVSGGSNGG